MTDDFGVVPVDAGKIVRDGLLTAVRDVGTEAARDHLKYLLYDRKQWLNH